MIDINEAIDEIGDLLQEKLDPYPFKSECRFVVRSVVPTTKMPSIDIAASDGKSAMGDGVQWEDEHAVFITIRNAYVERSENGKAFMALATLVAKALECECGVNFDIVSGIDIKPQLSENGEGKFVFAAVLTVHLQREW